MTSKVRRNSNDPNNPYRIGQMNELGNIICGAKLRNKDTKCTRLPKRGRTRCHLHGGSTKQGAQHHRANTLLYSNYVKGDFAQRYEDGVNDPQLIQLRHEIAYITTKIQDRMLLTESGLTHERWLRIQRTWNDFWLASVNGDTDKQQVLAHQMNSLVQNTTNSEAQDKIIRDLIDDKRKLVAAEQTRLVQAQQMVSIEQSMTLIAAMISAIKEAAYLFTNKDAADQIILHTAERYRQITGDREEKYITGVIEE